MMRHVTVQPQGKVITVKYCLEYQKDKASKAGLFSKGDRDKKPELL